jgi:hypothetical protein
MSKPRKPFQRTGNHDPKLALLRRADTERDSKGFSISGNQKVSRLVPPKPITLARVPSLERADEDDSAINIQ